MPLTQFDVDQQSLTQRQAALNGAMYGLQQMDKAAQTKRAMALQDQETAMKYREAGYDVTPDMLEKTRAEGPNGLVKLFGAEEPARPDLFGKRTAEYTAKIARDSEDRKFKRKMDEADMEFKQNSFKSDQQYKNAQMNALAVDSKKKQAEIDDLTSGNKFKRELTQEQVKKLGEGNAKILAVKSGIDNAIRQLDDPNMSADEKLKVGQETLKLLNSAEGADAVGSEEAQRLGSKLEYAMGNFFNSNPTQFGRDIPGFAEQLRNNSSRLAGRIKDNETASAQIMSGESLANIASAGTPKNPNTVALQPVNFRGQDPKVNFNPTKLPNMSPIQNANAAKAPVATQHPQANAALQWAQSNPNDPKAQEIIRRLGGN